MNRLYRGFIQRAGNQIEPGAAASGPPPRSLRAFMLWALQGGWRAIWFGVALSVMAGMIEVVSVRLLGAVVDAVAATPGAPFFAEHGWLIIACIVTFLLLRPMLFAGLALTQSVMIGPNIFMLAMSRLFRWTLGQSVTFFDNDFAGRLAQKKTQAANSLTEIVVETVNAVTFGIATLISTAVMVGAIAPSLIVVMLVWLAVYFAFLRLMLPIIRRRSAARAEAKAQVTGQVVDTISNIKTVKLFAGDTLEDDKALGAMESLRQKALYFGEAQTFFRVGLIFIAGILPLMMLGVAIPLGGAGGVSPGEITAVGAIGLRISQMTGWLSFTLMAIYSHVGEVEDGMRTLTPPDRIENSPNAQQLEVKQGHIAFEAVSFAYGRRSGGVQDINIAIAPGEKLGIVGASGAGKSTLVSLILRLYDTEAGRVLIDGQNVAEVTQESLRQQIGMVTQDTAMFNRTALDNIRYGRPDASEEEVMEAARKAEAHEFISQLRDHKGRTGYGAFLGERGVKLSGGQRQRIALARAILKDAPILILDEATSALDSEVEAAIQSALGRVMEGKTTLAIAHRLSTIASMDRIVVLDQGQVAETGSHSELLAKQGLYARYWERQSGGFIGSDEAPQDNTNEAAE